MARWWCLSHLGQYLLLRTGTPCQHQQRNQPLL
ncbi:hypothetical protein GLYMA_16G058250v4 [Glycine max]|nr:hypothetical protein GLYMA_16G058250v4 [Glycine max]KAH1150156.1 hypothetical protein GYH30_044275 [Glycine max]